MLIVPLYKMLRDVMTHDRVRDKTYTNLLSEQIDLLKNEIQHKNVVINSLLSNYEKLLNHVNNQTTVCKCKHENICSTQSHASQTIITEDQISGVTEQTFKVNERNITFRKRKSITELESKNDIPKPKVVLIGDSVLNNIHPRGLSKDSDVKVYSHPGATSDDIKHHINPSINRKPDVFMLVLMI